MRTRINYNTSIFLSKVFLRYLKGWILVAESRTRWTAVVTQTAIISLMYVRRSYRKLGFWTSLFILALSLLPQLRFLPPPVGSLACRNRCIAVPTVLMLEALWLDGTELLIGFWPLRAICLLWRNFQFVSIQCFTLSCRLIQCRIRHTCIQSWVCSDTWHALLPTGAKGTEVGFTSIQHTPEET